MYALQRRGTRIWRDGRLESDTWKDVVVSYPDVDTVKSGVKTPGWPIPQQRGELIVTPYSKDITYITAPNPYLLHVSHCPPQGSKKTTEHIETYFSMEQAINYFGGRWVMESPENNRDINPEALKRKAFEESNQEDWNVAVMIAEGHETLAMLVSAYSLAKNPTKNLTDMFIAACKNRGVNRLTAPLGQVFDKASSAWLTYRLGVKPLIADIASAYSFARKRWKLKYRAAKRPNQGSDQTITRSAISFNTNPYASSGFPYGSRLITENETLSRKDKCVITSDYDYENYTALFTDRLGLRGSQIPLLVWEKVPFSFVLDWFVDIGSWLSEIREPVGLVERVGTYSTRRDADRTLRGVDLHWKSFDGAYTWSQSNTWLSNHYEHKSFQYSRAVFDARLPKAYPGWGKGMDLVRKADAAALIFSGCRRRLRSVPTN